MCIDCGDSKHVSNRIEKININFIRDAILSRLMELNGGKVQIDQSIVNILRPCCLQDILLVAHAADIEVDII